MHQAKKNRQDANDTKEQRPGPSKPSAPDGGASFKADQPEAPGGPGVEPRWTSGAKAAVGTALSLDINSTSLVWFTLADGIFNEIFYPRLDRACVRNLGLVVTDGRDFFSEESRHTTHEVAYLADGVPAIRLTNTCKEGRYRIEKVIFAHPHQDAVLQQTRFTPLKGTLDDYHVYAIMAPHVGNQGKENTAWTDIHKGVPMLFARRGDLALALACSTPWLRGSAGFVGTSDGWRELSRHKQLKTTYGRAERGNVALTGEVDLAASGGAFLLSLGFGPDQAEAGHRALSGLLDDFDALQEKYLEGWRAWQKTLISLPPPEDGKAGRDLYRTSTAVLRIHDAEAVPGAIIASLSTPWGMARGDETPEGTGGYHLVWPRDMVEAAGGLIAAGAPREALRALGYIRATQEPDGHWPQNHWVSSAKYWDGIQLGETALPIVLTDHLLREGALKPEDRARVWPMVRDAASYIVRSGPSTQQDRWENQRGYTPYTLAAVVAALLAAADLADANNEASAAEYLRETADAWCGSIESWLYVTDTDLAHRLGVDGYYVRSIPPEVDDISVPREGRLRLKVSAPEHKGIPITEIVSPDALALVRFGLRAPDDPRIVNTVKVIDALTRVETPFGPCWHHYNGDGYGEHEDGSPYDGHVRGKGRAWPLLTGERAHFELAAGRRDEAVRLLHAMEAFAGDGALIPEQVWDTDDIPDRGLFFGRPTGSAMPLVWAHAEYIKLRRSLREGRIYDMPPQTVQRCLVEKVSSPFVVWRFDHQRAAIAPGDRLRIEVLSPGVVHWSGDGWQTTHETPTRDTSLGIHVADLPTAKLPGDSRVEFTFHWTEPGRWEGKNFAVNVRPVASGRPDIPKPESTARATGDRTRARRSAKP